MKNFKKAIWDSLHHWPIILLATLCSLGVATLWGANIGALLPVIEMTLDGNSTQSWLERKIKSDLSEIGNLEQAAAASSSNFTATNSGTNNRIKDLRQRVERNTWLLSWANRWLPKSPFSTVCVIMGVLVISTVVKHIMMLTSELLIGSVSTEIVRNLRTRVFDQALSMDRKTYQGYGTSGILATITHTSEALSNGLINFFGPRFASPCELLPV